ncbi:MAG: ATP-binding cassette domain-containing protein [Phycisphaerales bacterium]|nr:ATP-binding cassette domain-containing protein [Phycisphaerales bacterium]
MSSAQRISPISPTAIGSPAWISDELIGACASFGVVPSRGTQPRHRPIPLDAAMIDRIGRQRVVQIVGPSGAGKSSLLRCLAAHLDTGRVLIVPESLRAAQEQTASFDLLAGDADARASTLALAGLAEPRLWALPAGVLSCGERARLRLAMTMQRAGAGDVVVCDEFASNLDRVSAFALSRTVRRWAQRAGVTLIVASAHEDLESMLGADLVIDAGTRQTREGSPQQSQAIRIEPGSIEDYHALAHLHYRSGRPATIVRTLRAIRTTPTGDVLAGVLLVSMPTLNGVWRERAWPGRFSSGNKTLDARRLNDELRMISRVIVETRSRGLGVATRLVRTYLENPLTPGTEAVAAMGATCPFFARAGMMPYELVPDIHDTRLLDALRHLGRTPGSLLHARIKAGSLLARELTSWGKRRKLLGPGLIEPETLERLTPLAACRLCSRPRAYAFTKGNRGDAQHDT